jgi:hypothetical protein
MLLDYALGQTSIVLRVKIRNSSVSTGAGLTGLTSSSTGLRIATIADNEATPTAYTVAGSTIETITTLGTFATPTATKCRFKEVDATNHPGVYELQIDNTRFAVASAKSLLITISGATNAAECDVCIPLRTVNPYSAAFGLTLAKTTNITGFNDIAATAIVSGGAITTSSGAVSTVTTLTNAPSDSDGVTSLLTRITSARAVYLDNLNVGGVVASHADITGLDTATPLARVYCSPSFIKPTTGTITYPIVLEIRNLSGILTDADSGIPGITTTFTNGAGADRSGNLSGWTKVSTGTYQRTYTVTSTDADEPMIGRFTGAVSGNAFSATATPDVADYNTYNTTDRTMLTALYNLAPANVLLVDGSGKVSLSASQVYNNTGQTTKVAATLLSSDITGTPVANVTQWGGSAVTGMPLPTSSYTAQTGDAFARIGVAGAGLTALGDTRLSNLDATISSRSTFVTGGSVVLSSDGLDNVVVETGVNARQALSPILAAAAGVLSGATTGTIVVKGANVATTRITATTDANGNRSAVTLSLPT